MLKQTENFLKWQAENSKATLSPEQKRRARVKASILRHELVKIIDKKYQAELDEDSDEGSSSYELSGNMSFDGGYYGDDEAPSGSVGNHGEIDMDGFQVVDCDDLSDDEEDTDEEY